MQFVFSISRLRSGRSYGGQVLVLHEYLSKGGDLVGLATCHLDNFYFISGLPLAIVQGDNVMYSSKVKEEFKSVHRQYRIQFSQQQATKLLSQVEPLRVQLQKPPKNDKEVSVLREYQLIVECKPTLDYTFSQPDKGVCFEIEAASVVDIFIVDSSNPLWIQPNPDAKRLSAEEANLTMYQTTSLSSIGQRMTVAEFSHALRQEKDRILVRMKGRSKSERRQACKAINDSLQTVEGKDPTTVITVDLSSIEEFSG